jgi:hypothetical protein
MSTTRLTLKPAPKAGSPERHMPVDPDCTLVRIGTHDVFEVVTFPSDERLNELWQQYGPGIGTISRFMRKDYAALHTNYIIATVSKAVAPKTEHKHLCIQFLQALEAECTFRHEEVTGRIDYSELDEPRKQ